MYINSTTLKVNEIIEKSSSIYGNQAIGISYDYCEGQDARYMYNTKLRCSTEIKLMDMIETIKPEFYSDILLTNTTRTGKLEGIDWEIMEEPFIKNLANPVVLSGGLISNGFRHLADKRAKYINLSGVAASSSIFKMNGSESTLISIEKHFT